MQEIKSDHFTATVHRYTLSDVQEGADQDMLCLICKNLPLTPQECRDCRSVLCTLCIAQYLDINRTCPQKCKECILVKPHPYFLKGLLNLLVRCVWCAQILPYKDVASHECDQKQFKCDICGQTVMAKEKATHRANCNYFDCAKCGADKCPPGHECIAYLKGLIEEEKNRSQEKIKGELVAKENLKKKLMETQGQLIELKMQKGVAGGDKATLKAQIEELRQRIKWMNGNFDGKDHRALHCPKKHLMKKYKNLPPDYNHSAKCNQCKAPNIEKYSQFFLHCADCKYDVCAKCFIAEIN